MFEKAYITVVTNMTKVNIFSVMTTGYYSSSKSYIEENNIQTYPASFSLKID